MKPHNIKYILLILTILPGITTAETYTPSEEARKAFRKCVVAEGKAWSACYDHLYSYADGTAEENEVSDSNLIARKEPKQAIAYYAPRWVYRLLPTFNPPNDTEQTSLWATD